MIAKTKPNWAGEDFLSQIVNALIRTKPLYQLMKHQARQVLIGTAERSGVPWRRHFQELEQSEVKTLLVEMTDPKVAYPDYYQVPFHAYDRGNLCWEAAFEATPATLAMALRIWPKEQLTGDLAQERLRASFLDILGKYSPSEVRTVLDVGCSVGISTQTLHRYFSTHYPQLRTLGLDLSPYMLAVAKHQDRNGDIAQWVHAKAEETAFPDDTFDVVTLQFVLHELPGEASRQIFREIRRILRPGGILGIVDNNPRSAVIQNLPPALFVLMKSTEPWSDDYYTFDVEAALQESGFDYKVTLESDPRHRTIVAAKP